MSRWLRRVAPVALLATGACFATREDVQLLQQDFDRLRAESARADSTRARQLDQLVASMRSIQDSLGLVSSHLVKMNGDVRGDLYQMGQQLIAVQELTGQSQRRLQELRASLEQRSEEIQQQQGAPPTGEVPAGTNPTAPGATGATGASPAPGAAGAPPTGATTSAAPTTGAAAPATPGPNQLFQLGLDQLRRGSTGAARTAFQTLVQQYPNADVVPDAYFYLGEAARADGDAAAADSAYATVVDRYPTSPRAPTALYKRALAMEEKGNLTGARAALNILIQKYPRSDEAALAREHLRSMKK